MRFAAWRIQGDNQLDVQCFHWLGVFIEVEIVSSHHISLPYKRSPWRSFFTMNTWVVDVVQISMCLYTEGRWNNLYSSIYCSENMEEYFCRKWVKKCNITTFRFLNSRFWGKKNWKGSLVVKFPSNFFFFFSLFSERIILKQQGIDDSRVLIVKSKMKSSD